LQEQTSCHFSYLLSTYRTPTGGFDALAYRKDCLKEPGCEDGKTLDSAKLAQRNVTVKDKDGTDVAGVMGPAKNYQTIAYTGGSATVTIDLSNDIGYEYLPDNATLVVSSNVDTVKIEVRNKTSVLAVKLGSKVQTNKVGDPVEITIRGFQGLVEANVNKQPASSIVFTITTKDGQPPKVAKLTVDYCEEEVCASAENMEVVDCANGGDICGPDGAETCEQRGDTAKTCVPEEAVSCDIKTCKCKEGFYRDKDNKCVREEECGFTTTQQTTTSTTPTTTTICDTSKCNDTVDTCLPTEGVWIPADQVVDGDGCCGYCNRTAKEIGEVTTQPPATTTSPSQCTDVEVNVGNTKFIHPQFGFECVLPDVTIRRCKGSCDSMSTPQLISVNFGDRDISVNADGVTQQGCDCCQGDPSFKEVEANCAPGFGNVKVKVMSYTNCGCKECKEEKLKEQFACVNRQVKFSTLPEQWFKLTATPHFTAVAAGREHTPSVGLAGSDAALTDPIWTNKAFYKAEKKSSNWVFKYRVDFEGTNHNYKVTSDVKFSYRNVKPNTLRVYSIGLNNQETDLVVKTNSNGAATYEAPSLDVKAVVIKAQANNANAGIQVYNMGMDVSDCGNVNIAQPSA